MITRLKEKPGSRHATEAIDGNEYEYVLTALSNTGLEDENTIYATAGVPRLGQVYVNRSRIEASAPCIERTVERVDRLVWEVRCRFSSKVSSQQGKNLRKDPDKPLTWPVEIHWSGKRIEVNYNFDIKGNPFVNSCGDALKNVPSRSIYHAVVTLARMEAAYNPVFASEFAGKVNSSTWFACPANTALCEWPEATLTYFENIDRYFWKIAYSFEIAPEGWNSQPGLTRHPYAVADRGRQCFASQSAGLPAKTKIPTTDDLGNPTGDDAFLDGYGYQYTVDLATGKLPKVVWPNGGPFKFFDYANFNQLGLG